MPEMGIVSDLHLQKSTIILQKLLHYLQQIPDQLDIQV